MSCCLHGSSVDVPVSDVIQCVMVAEEDAIISIGVQRCRAITRDLGSDLSTKSDDTVNRRAFPCVCLVGGVVDGCVVCAIVKPGNMEECISPKFNTKASRIEHAANPFLDGAVRAFNNAVLG